MGILIIIFVSLITILLFIGRKKKQTDVEANDQILELNKLSSETKELKLKKSKIKKQVKEHEKVETRARARVDIAEPKLSSEVQQEIEEESEYNPFVNKYNRTLQSINKINTDMTTLEMEFKRYELFTTGSYDEYISVNKALENCYYKLIPVINDLVDTNREAKNEYISRQKNNFFSWLRIDQKLLKKEVVKIDKNIKDEITEMDAYRNSLSNLLKTKKIVASYISKYKKININDVINKYDKLCANKDTKNYQLIKITAKKEEVEMAIRPIVSQINDYNKKISDAKSKIKYCKNYDDQLNNAANRYERAMIHKECEKKYNEGSPSIVIRSEEKRVRTLERSLKKTESRAISVSRKFSRYIKKIVIDGNNMCYQGDEFVGLPPLIKAVEKLFHTYDVVVIFDSDIRQQIRSNDKKIRSQFVSDIKLHIVPSEQKADETILDIASNDKSCYILSNDRFGEYNDKEVVKNDRLIKHEVIDNKIIIHDLAVNSSF